MVKAQTTREQAEIAKQRGCALFAFACKSGGTVSMDGPLSHDIAKPLIRLMALITSDRVSARSLEHFVQLMEEQ